MEKIATDCAKQYREAEKPPSQLANAGLHAATAYNAGAKFTEAMALLERVSTENRADPRVRTDAKFQLAAAYIGESGKLQATSPDRGALLGKGITALEDLLNSGVQRGTPLYSQVVFQRATAYQTRASGTLDFNNAIDGFALIAEGGAGVDATLRENARRNLIDAAVKAGANELRPDTSDSPAAQRAVALYEKALKFDPRNLDLNIGLGDARLIIARAAAAPDQAAWFARARDAYAEALNAGPTGPKLQLVNAGLGRATRGLGQLRESIGFYKAAAGNDIKINSELGETQVEYARGLNEGAEKQTAYKDAEQTYRNLLKLPGVPAASKASILITLADVQGQQPNRVADVRATLLEALAADPGSVGSRLQLAKNYFTQSMFGEAEGHFLQVVSATGGANGAPPPGQAKFKADAYYYLSMVKARGGAASKEAVDYADQAVRVGGSESPYREQACVAHILRGGASVADNNSIWCAGGDDPQGLLLRGMFYLRHSQYAPATAKSISRDAAKFAFEQGLREANRAGATPKPLSFTWPGSSATPPAVRDLLEYGTGVVEGCAGLSAQVDLTQAQYDAASSFYSFYKVNECKPN
jgi:tetratricopeptide (TPR) repeat protein